MPIAKNLRKGSQLLSFESGLHGEIGIIPVRHHAQSLEVFTLTIHLFSSIFTTGLTEHARFKMLHFLATCFFYLMFDWQAMAIPSRNEGCIVTIK